MSLVNRSLLIFLVLPSAGCALWPDWHWEKPGASEAVYQQDEIICKQRSYAGADGHVTQADVRRMQACMMEKGWRKVKD